MRSLMYNSWGSKPDNSNREEEEVGRPELQATPEREADATEDELLPDSIERYYMKNKPSPLMDKDRAIELLNKYGFRGPKEVKIAVATYLLEKLIDGKDS